jgi:hypothetical protein
MDSLGRDLYLQIFHSNQANHPQPIPTMSTQHLLKLTLALGASAILSSCAAGVVDRTEDRMDRREDRYDRRVYTGPGDRVEDYYDKRENVNDKLRGRRGLLY